MKRFTDSDRDLFTRMIQAMVFDRDVARFRSIVEHTGLLRPGLDVSDALIGEYFSHFYDFVLSDEVTTIDPEYASESVRRIFDAGGPYREIIRNANVPPSFVIIQRINLGLYSILGQLRATANWRRVAEELWPFTAGEPSTPMGVDEHRWLQQRGEGQARLHG